MGVGGGDEGGGRVGWDGVGWRVVGMENCRERGGGKPRGRAMIEINRGSDMWNMRFA